jgi:hypothetical protein
MKRRAGSGMPCYGFADPIIYHKVTDPEHCTLLQDLTQDSATLTGWRRTKRSGEGKMITLYGPGIFSLAFRSFPQSPEFSGVFYCEKMKTVQLGRLEPSTLGTLILSSTTTPRLPCIHIAKCSNTKRRNSRKNER